MSYRYGAYAITGLLFLTGLYLRFSYDPKLPPRPARPRPSDLTEFRALDYSQNLFRARLEKDAAEYGVPLDPLTGVFRMDATEPGREVSSGGPTLERRDLLISARVEKLNAPLERGKVLLDHFVLRIENRTDKYLAYRVIARLPIDPRSCVEKGDLGHNAIAIAPREVLERTECARPGVRSAIIERVETIELPALAYRYVSQLFPRHIGLDARAGHGHRPPGGSVCNDIPEQAILRGIEKGTVSWRDVIDFYGRHNCRDYIFPVGYRAFTRDGERALPVAPSAPAPSP